MLKLKILMRGNKIKERYDLEDWSFRLYRTPYMAPEFLGIPVVMGKIINSFKFNSEDIIRSSELVSLDLDSMIVETENEL